MRLAGKHAVVTGGTRGIGAAIARALCEEGARVTAFGRETADVSDAAAVRDAFAQFGRVDILINNAGQAASAPFLKTDGELWRRMIAVNLDGAFHCTQAALPGMIEAGWGRIVNVASTAGLAGYSYVTAYCAAKHGLIGLTRALAIELAAKNITVNAVCPGFTDTDLLQDAIANIVAKTGRTVEQARAEISARNPQKRLIRPEEVASAVVWLCLPESASINGQAIAIDGGER
ncbi:MAG TPA: SDR family NAD(P)-dependent oxidoreductase [Bryobacteraceae bacterium]|nr:SDR family NAD(P)-dependent oxidoreductase [Bryobacteraceae bacterium]